MSISAPIAGNIYLISMNISGVCRPSPTNLRSAQGEAQPTLVELLSRSNVDGPVTRSESSRFVTNKG